MGLGAGVGGDAGADGRRLCGNVALFGVGRGLGWGCDIDSFRLESLAEPVAMG